MNTKNSVLTVLIIAVFLFLNLGLSNASASPTLAQTQSTILFVKPGEEGGAGQNVEIEMTLTAPNCPVAEQIPQQVQQAAASVEGVGRVDVRLVWEPRWDRSRMSEAALLELGLL